MGKLGSTRELSRMALKTAEGLFAHSVDMTLWITIYCAEISLPQSVSGQIWRARIEADRFLSKINYDVIKNALITAKRNKWIKTTRRGAMPEITEEGKRRLSKVLPQYDVKRTWDGRIHLVTYDIPEVKKRQREILREQLRSIGCGKLQDSVWMTPYNPIDILRSFIAERRLGGTIIISDLGHDASIGEEDLQSLVVRVYKLEELNERYIQWLEEVDRHGSIGAQLVVGYLVILKDDPQLPFDLLPDWWEGDKAYKKVKEKVSSLSIDKL